MPMSPTYHPANGDYGYTPDPSRVREFLRTMPAPRCSDTNLGTSEDWKQRIQQGPFLNFLPLLEVEPDWERGAQGIGDCESWGHELVATMEMALQHKLGTGLYEGQAATEAIYGGGRVEAHGGQLGGWSDGANGSDMAAWLKNGGVLLRKDYSQLTGNSEHDLRTYSAQKAKSWGNYGCGGQNDKGKLDEIARKKPIAHVALIDRGCEQAMAGLGSGYLISISSGAGFGGMNRDANGVCRWSSRWSHCMMIGAGRMFSQSQSVSAGYGRLQFLCFQSWGPDVASGPMPGLMPGDYYPIITSWLAYCAANGIRLGADPLRAIRGTSWWIDESDFTSILDGQDCYMFADVQGMTPRALDFTQSFSSFG